MRRPLALWLAVLLAWFGALAPTISHALVSLRSDAAPTQLLCTSRGVQALATPLSTDSPDGQESTPTLDHCPFCLLFTDRGAPPSHALAHPFFVSGEPGEPTVRQAFFFDNRVALTPPPRGPPRFC